MQLKANLKNTHLWMISALWLAGAACLPAQSTPPPLPVTGVLAISKMPPGVAREDLMKIFPDEVRATVRLYLQGKITHWYSRPDRSGVIFILDCKDAVEARALLDELPFGKAKLLDFDLIPVSPLAPLGLLLGDPPGARKSAQ
jgi:hypothetical protein